MIDETNAANVGSGPRLFDGGTTEDGVPYIVMEYIDGEPIDTYCDRRNLTRFEDC